MNEFSDDPEDAGPLGEVQQVLFWLENHAAAGDCAAQLELSKAYEEGLMTPARPGDALAWEDRSAQQGYAPAMISQAMRRLEGRNILQNTFTALRLLDELMDADPNQKKGHARLILNCARDYHEAVPANDAAAYLVAFNFLHSRVVTSAQRRAAETLIDQLEPRAVRDGVFIKYDFAAPATGLIGAGTGIRGLRIVPAYTLNMPPPYRPHDKAVVGGHPIAAAKP
ncbi:MAG: hypothetical protein P4M15_05825 [Alphaproteobacteria bacterium]|nr:hypothetical protein [Alphaproteobacteria bacterium]